jgi:hypothetical protein
VAQDIPANIEPEKLDAAGVTLILTVMDLSVESDPHCGWSVGCYALKETSGSFGGMAW